MTHLQSKEPSGPILREQDARRLLEVSFDGIWAIDADLRTTFVNPRMAEIVGYTPDEMLGRTLLDFMFPEDVPAEREAMGRRRRGVREEFEIRYRRSDGSEVWARVATAPILGEGGEFLGAVGIHSDVTARRQIEQTLRQRDAELNEAERLAQIGSWHWDPASDTVVWSQGLYRIAGRDPKLPPPNYKTEHPQLYSPESWQRLQAAVAAALTQGLPYEVDLEMIRTDGTTRWVVARGEAERDVVGRVRALRGTVHDITARKQAEDALRRSEEQFRALANSIPQLAWMAEPDGWIVWFNRRWYEYTGTTPEQMEGWGWEAVHDPAQLPAVLEHWRGSLETGEPFEMIFPLRRADGAFRPFLTRIVPVCDDDGRVLRWFGTNTDISMQLEREDALRESQERLHAALAASRTGTFRWDPETGDFAEFDDNLKYLFGMERGDRVRTTEDFIARVHPDDRPAVLPAIERCRQGADLEVEYRVLLPDGSVRWLYDRGKMQFENGRPAYLVGACTDITERKLAEQARLELAAIVESSDDVVFSKDLDGNIRSWNAAAMRVLGYAPEEIIGKPVFAIVPPELHHEEAAILARLRAGERIEHYETKRLRRDGERIEMSLTISPLRDANGTLVGASVIARDITARKRSEEALRTSEKLATVGRLAATVAHEINNPLESVVNLVYLANLEADHPDKVRAYLQGAEEELARISHLAKQTLGFYREHSSAVRLRAGDLLGQLVNIFLPKARTRQIRLELKLDADPEIVIVPGELRQLAANLLSNSLDATAVGGRIVMRVTQIGRPGGEHSGLRITVADTGSGIKPQDRARLFEPFFTTKRDIGTGLGLWVCNEIVTKHRGRIRLRSNTTPGRSWTVVSAFLPILAAETHAVSPSALTNVA